MWTVLFSIPRALLVQRLFENDEFDIEVFKGFYCSFLSRG